MRFQIALLVEALATELTLVHAYLGMRPHVVGQVCQLFKSSPTFLALVWFFTWVSVAMNLHVDFLVKPLAAEIAAEGLVIRVSTHVRVQVRGAVEGLVALLANVWLGRCVGKLMTGYVTQLSKGASTLLAHVRFGSGVNALVGEQCTGASECPATLITHVLGFGLWTIVMTIN